MGRINVTSTIFEGPLGPNNIIDFFNGYEIRVHQDRHQRIPPIMHMRALIGPKPP